MKHSLPLVLQFFGPTLSWFKDKYLLLVLTVAFGVAAAFDFVGSSGWRIGLALAAVLLLALERLADLYDEKVRELDLQNSEASAERATQRVNDFLHWLVKATAGGKKPSAWTAMHAAAQSANSTLGDDARTMFYELEGSAPERVLREKITIRGSQRTDGSDRPFIEKDSPELDVWRLLDRPDTEPQPVEVDPEERRGARSPTEYATYYSIPVRTESHVFGMLSVNHRQVGAIGATQRAAILAIARALAIFLATQAVDTKGNVGGPM